MFYIVIGIVLLLLSAGTIAVMVLFEIKMVGQETSNREKNSEEPYSKAFLAAIPRAYESSGTLQGMLTLLIERCPKKMDGRKQCELPGTQSIPGL